MLFPKPRTLSEPPRVVITGAGVVSALGIGWAANAEGFRGGRPAFGPVSVFDASRQRTKIAAEVKLPANLPTYGLSARQAGRLVPATHLLLLAATEAWGQAGWEPSADLPLVLGTTAGGMAMGEVYYHQAVNSPRRQRHQPTRALHYQMQIQGRLAAEALGFQGPITIVSNACASGANALGLAADMIRCGRAERALAGGYDALCQMVFAGFDSLQALSPSPCRPFDAGRDGLSLGEGAAVVTLETLASARRRGAEILGELAGYASTIDLHHLTQPHPEGAAAFESMSQACAQAGVNPEQIGYLNAHGTGTLLNDRAEALAIQRWAGVHARTIPVSSTKAAIGHTLGAAGAIEAVVCLMALREQWLPPEITLENPDPICCFPLVRKPTDAPVNLALSNSFGFGGVNASLVLRRWA